MTVNLRSDVGTESTLSSVPAFPGHQNDLPVRAPCSDPPRDPTRDTRGNDPTSNVKPYSARRNARSRFQLPGAQTRAAQSPRLSHEWWNKSLTSNVYQCCCISYIIDLLYNSAVHEPTTGTPVSPDRTRHPTPQLGWMLQVVPLQMHTEGLSMVADTFNEVSISRSA